MDSHSNSRADSAHANDETSPQKFAARTVRQLRQRSTRTAAVVALTYGTLGVAWIVFSDRWLADLSLESHVDWLPLGQVKGIGFVSVTAIALYALMRWGLFRWRRIESQVRESAALMRTVVQTMPSAMVILNAGGKIVFANHHAQAVLGLAPVAMLGMRFDNPHWGITGLDGAATPSDELPFAQAMRWGSPVLGAVHCIQPPGCARRVLSVNAAPMFSADGAVSEVVATISDITSQQQAGQDAERTSHALHALADLGAVALQAHSTGEIFEYACTALVEHEVCAACWIGRVNTDAERSITPIAASGDARDFVKTLRVSWDSSALGQGPAGRAVRTRKPVVVERLDLDAGFAPWREAALERGFVSVFAIPVLDASGSPVKLLCGYARTLGTFRQAECEVLNEFAQRIGTVARAVRKRRSHEDNESRILSALQGTIRAVQRTVEARDPYTYGHQERVALLSVAIADDLGFPKEQRMAVEIAAKMHDVGKLMVPAEILSKPTRLNSAEYELIKGHVEAGYQILNEIDFGLPVAEIMRQHHERLDGSGYPQALRGSQIRLEARVLAVADVAESMLSHRPYRPARGFAEIKAELQAGRALRYDADAVDACLRVLSGSESPLRA
jgi:putative nucleotidyltransferase with HDIG domain